jgi:uncharacterized protein (DUF2237 family)
MSIAWKLPENHFLREGHSAEGPEDACNHVVLSQEVNNLMHTECAHFKE